MPYEIRVTPQALKDIGKLPEKIRPAMLEAMHGSIAENPQRAGKQLHFELASLMSARRGEFRIVYQIDSSERRVVILRVAHRREAYRRR